MPQQREYSICITLLSPPARGRGKDHTFLLVLSGKRERTPYRRIPARAEGNTTLYQQSVLPDSQTGSRHQNEFGLKCPVAYPECPSRSRFHTSLWPKRSGGRRWFTARAHLLSQPHQPLTRNPRSSPQTGCYPRAGDKDVPEQ